MGERSTAVGVEGFFEYGSKNYIEMPRSSEKKNFFSQNHKMNVKKISL